jgi:hypothetical protein
VKLFAVWPRIFESLLGAWLTASASLFGATTAAQPIAGAAVIAFSMLSLVRRTAWMHWFTGVAALWIGGIPYFTVPRPGPPAAQNEIVIALLLLMTFLLPTWVTSPPESWKRLERGGSREIPEPER